MAKCLNQVALQAIDYNNDRFSSKLLPKSGCFNVFSNFALQTIEENTRFNYALELFVSHIGTIQEIRCTIAFIAKPMVIQKATFKRHNLCLQSDQTQSVKLFEFLCFGGSCHGHQKSFCVRWQEFNQQPCRDWSDRHERKKH